MSNYKKNAVKLLPIIQQSDNQVVLYTEFDGMFDVGDKVYIMIYSGITGEYEQFDSFYNSGCTCDENGFFILEKKGNRIKINKKYKDINVNLLNNFNIFKNAYIGKIYMKNVEIKNGTINGSILHDVKLQPETVNDINWMQAVVSTVKDNKIDNIKFKNKYNKEDLILKSEIVLNKIESYYTKNNNNTGLSIINLSNNIVDISGSDVYDGTFKNCYFDTVTDIPGFPTDNILAYIPLNGSLVTYTGTTNYQLTANSGQYEYIEGVSKECIHKIFGNSNSLLYQQNLSYRNFQPDFSSNVSFSVSLWFKTDSILSSISSNVISNGLFIYRWFAGNQLPHSILGIDINNINNNSPYVRFGINSKKPVPNNNIYDDAPNTTIEHNKWYNVVMTYNHIDAKYKGYINGVMVCDRTTVAFNILSPGDSLSNAYIYFGTRHSLTNINTNSNSFKGSIDEIRIYNKELSESDILMLYNYPGGPMANERNIYSGDIINSTIGKGYIINDGNIINTTLESETVWEYGIWENDWDGTGTNPFGPIQWKDGIWINGELKNKEWLDGIFINGNINSVSWKNGVFNNGTISTSNWYNGTFNNGEFNNNSTWHNGTFNNGVFDDSIWNNGTFNGGNIRNGSTWYNGTFNNGLIEESTWWNGTFNDGTIDNYTIWKDGRFNNGTFTGYSTWNNGTFHGGIFDKSTWKDGKFYNGTIFGNETIWENGEFFYGVVNDMNWIDGIWHDGIVNNINWSGGTWYNGIFNYGFFNSGDWYNGSFNGGYFGGETDQNDTAIWHDGIFYFGEFNGKWMEGTFYKGKYDGAVVGFEPKNVINSFYVQYNKSGLVQKSMDTSRYPKHRRF